MDELRTDELDGEIGRLRHYMIEQLRKEHQKSELYRQLFMCEETSPCGKNAEKIHKVIELIYGSRPYG
jgi:hypothetical protein